MIPPTEVNTIISEDVPTASIILKPNITTMMGTKTTPPPIPRSHEVIPVINPHKTNSYLLIDLF